MKIRYLGYNEVLEIYREQINKFGGYCAIRDNNALLSIIANPQRQFAGVDLYPSIAKKAAIFVYTMVKSHPFADGNKRTAFVCGRMILRYNGYDIGSPEKYYDLILKIAKNEATKEDIFEWFEFSATSLSELGMKKKEKKE